MYSEIHKEYPCLFKLATTKEEAGNNSEVQLLFFVKKSQLPMQRNYTWDELAETNALSTL